MRALHQGIESVGPHEEIEYHCLDANVNSGCLKYFSSQSRKEKKDRLKLVPGSHVAASVSNLKVVTRDNQASCCHRLRAQVLEF